MRTPTVTQLVDHLSPQSSWLVHHRPLLSLFLLILLRSHCTLRTCHSPIDPAAAFPIQQRSQRSSFNKYIVLYYRYIALPTLNILIYSVRWLERGGRTEQVLLAKRIEV